MHPTFTTGAWVIHDVTHTLTNQEQWCGDSWVKAKLVAFYFPFEVELIHT